jgi:solute carrier family 12 (sodium/potassium/chloride transporter), member 2
VIAMKLLRKSHGIMIAGHVILGDLREHFSEYERVLKNNSFKQLKLKGFNSVVMAPDLQQGVSALLQISGLGKLRANTVLMGFKRSWQECSDESVSTNCLIALD